MNNAALPRTPREGELHLVVLFLCFVLVYFTWFPGVFTKDELDIFTQSLGGPKHDGHSPLMVRFWGLTGRIAQGPAIPYLVGLSAVLYFSYSLLRRVALTRAASAGAMCALVLMPPVFVALGLVTKDLFFVAATLALLVALARHFDQPRRASLLVVALTAQLAILIRIDAVFALLPLLVYLCWRQLTVKRGDSLAVKVLALALAAVLILCFMGASRLASRYVFQASPFHAEQVTMLFDLSALSIENDAMLLPASRLSGGFPLPVMRARLNPAIADGLIWSADANNLVYAVDANHTELAAAWFAALRRYPSSYIKFRAEYMAQFIGVRNNTARLRGQFHADESMVGDGSQGWRKTHSPLQRFYHQLSESAWGRYLYMPWLWLVGGLLVLFGFASGWLRGNGTDTGRIIPQLLVTSAMSYTFLMSMISTASLARYHSWPRVAIGIAMLAALLQFVPALKNRVRHWRARDCVNDTI